jgi:hypothetical protein
VAWWLLWNGFERLKLAGKWRTEGLKRNWRRVVYMWFTRNYRFFICQQGEKTDKTEKRGKVDVGWRFFGMRRMHKVQVKLRKNVTATSGSFLLFCFRSGSFPVQRLRDRMNFLRISKKSLEFANSIAIKARLSRCFLRLLSLNHRHLLLLQHLRQSKRRSILIFTQLNSLVQAKTIWNWRLSLRYYRQNFQLPIIRVWNFLR